MVALGVGVVAFALAARSLGPLLAHDDIQCIEASCLGKSERWFVFDQTHPFRVPEVRSVRSVSAPCASNEGAMIAVELVGSDRTLATAGCLPPEASIERERAVRQYFETGAGRLSIVDRPDRVAAYGVVALWTVLGVIALKFADRLRSGF